MKEQIKNVAIIAFLFTFITSNGFAQIQPDSSMLTSKVLVAAHRGDWRNAPENSLQSFNNAVRMGVDIIELDLSLTKDGIVIIMHDETIDRTTNGTGKPADYTLEELKKLFLKAGQGIITNHTIPTLKEAMLLLKNRVLVNLDKSYPYYKEAYQVLKETGTLKQGLFKSDADYISLRKKYGNLIDSIVYMPYISLSKADAVTTVKEFNKKMKPYAFELSGFNVDTSALLKNPALVKASGAKIWMNSLWPSLCAGHNDDKAVEENKPDETWGWLIAHGATIIQTDRPKELLEYLRGKGLHR